MYWPASGVLNYMHDSYAYDIYIMYMIYVFVFSRIMHELFHMLQWNDCHGIIPIAMCKVHPFMQGLFMLEDNRM